MATQDYCAAMELQMFSGELQLSSPQSQNFFVLNVL